MQTDIHIKLQFSVQNIGSVQSIGGTYLSYITGLVRASAYCKLFVGARFGELYVWFNGSSWWKPRLPVSHNSETNILYEWYMCTLVSLENARYLIIFEYPNAAHTPFSQIPICYSKYSTVYPSTCMGGTWNTWWLSDFSSLTVGCSSQLAYP